MFRLRKKPLQIAWAILLTCLPAWSSAQEKPAASGNAPPARAEAEQLAALLRSEAPHDQKTLACKRLAAIGGKDAVEALAPLVLDEQLSHAARIGLEAIPDAAADAALRAALPKLRGKLLVGVINSIGMRRDAPASGDLRARLGDSDPEVAMAAAAALGRIASPEAARALVQSLVSVPPRVRPAVADACLACAEAAQSQGKREEAAALYDRVCSVELPKHLRLAATRGAIVVRQSQGMELLVAQLQDQDDAMFALGLSVGRELSCPGVTQTLLGQLAGLSSERQALLITVLGDRGDAAALPAVIEAARSARLPVRLAALRALSSLGDASAVPLLLQAAGNAEPQVAATAQDSLTALALPEVDGAVVGMLEKANGPSRRFLLELAGRRRIASALPKLMEAADDPDQEVRLAAVRALGNTVAAEQFPALVKRLVAAANPAELAATLEALRAASARLAGEDACGRALVACLPQASPAVKCFVLELLGVVGGPTGLRTVSDAAFDASEEVQDAATRVLGEWMDPDAAPALLEVARKSSSNKFRTRALRGYIRIIRQMDLRDDQKLAMCRDALAAAQRNEERELVYDALRQVSRQTGDPDVARRAQELLPRAGTGPAKAKQ